MIELYNINWRKEIRQEFIQQLKEKRVFRGLRYTKLPNLSNTYASIRVSSSFDDVIGQLGGLVQIHGEQMLITQLHFSVGDKDYYIARGPKSYHLHEELRLFGIQLTEEEAHSLAVTMQGKGCSFRIHTIDRKVSNYYGVRMSVPEFDKFCQAMFDLGKQEFTYKRGYNYWKVIHNGEVKNVVKLE